jgi:hypothetical protein
MLSTDRAGVEGAMLDILVDYVIYIVKCGQLQQACLRISATRRQRNARENDAGKTMQGVTGPSAPDIS